MPKIRMIDIAEHCGVSKAAVVRALNRPVERSELRPETWARIRAAAESLGYRADWRARALAGGRSHTIGLLYDGLYPPLQGFPGRITAEIARFLSEASYDLLLLPTDREGWREKLVDRRCDAAVIVGEVPLAIDGSESLPLPVVTVNARGRNPYPRVEPDDAGGAALAVAHLRDLGHRRIAYFGEIPSRRRAHPSAQARHQGYRDAMRAARLQPQVFPSLDSLEGILGQAALRPTAIVAYTDAGAARIMQSAYRRGLRVPDDLSLIAFNDDPEGALLSPPLTTIALPIQPMGRAAADLVLRLLDGDDDVPPITAIPEDLRLRESTAPM